jgi:MoxR-like ATPase
MDTKAAGRLGGKVRSEKKRAACAVNLAKARKKAAKIFDDYRKAQTLAEAELVVAGAKADDAAVAFTNAKSIEERITTLGALDRASTSVLKAARKLETLSPVLFVGKSE